MAINLIQETDSLHSGMDKMNNAILAFNETQAGDSSLESAAARVDGNSNVYTNLKERLDTEHADLVDDIGAINTNLDATNDIVATNTNNISINSNLLNTHTNQISSLSSGSPKGTYATLTALTTAFPSGNTNTYVVTADGKWYYWSGSVWTVGGTYQSTGIGAKTVSVASLTDEVRAFQYPFQERATLSVSGASESILALRDGIFDIKLYGADATKNYSLSKVIRKSGTTHVSAIDIWNSDTYGIVCSFYATNYVEPTGIDTVSLVAVNSSGITAKIMIDWSKFPNPASYQSLIFSNCGISKKCIVTKLSDADINASIASANVQITDVKSYTKFPFSKNALMYRSTYSDGTVDRKAIVSLHFTAKYNEKYFIQEMINNTTYRQITIRNSSLTENISCRVLQTVRYLGAEFITLTCDNEIRGYAIINWDTITAYNGYVLADTEIDESCVIPFTMLKNKSLIDIPELVLPDEMYAVVGHEFNIYFNTIVKCRNIENFHWKATLGDGTIGSQYSDRLSYIPVVGDIGDKTLTISIYDNNSVPTVPLITKTITLHIQANATLSTVEKIICIGDSYTELGHFIAEIKNMVGSNLEFVGTRTATQNDANGTSRIVSHEGRSGWTSTDYMLASKGDTVNPFYNPSTSLFDFSYYITQQGYAGITAVNILIGTNDGYNWANTQAPLQLMVNSIKTYDANIKVFVMTLSPTPLDAYGYGRNNHTSGYRNWENQQYMLGHVQGILTDYVSRKSEKIYIVPCYCNIDREYDYDSAEISVSQRNPALKTVTWDNVHIGKYGFYKISDEFYNVFRSTL